MRKVIGAVVVVGFVFAGLLVTSASGGSAPTSPQTFADPALNPQSFTVPADVCEHTRDDGSDNHEDYPKDED